MANSFASSSQAMMTSSGPSGARSPTRDANEQRLLNDLAVVPPVLVGHMESEIEKQDEQIRLLEQRLIGIRPDLLEPGKNLREFYQTHGSAKASNARQGTFSINAANQHLPRAMYLRKLREHCEIKGRIVSDFLAERESLAKAAEKLKNEIVDLGTMETVLKARVEYQTERKMIFERLRERREGVRLKVLYFNFGSQYL